MTLFFWFSPFSMCRHWRNMAVSDPDIFSHISDNSVLHFSLCDSSAISSDFLYRTITCLNTLALLCSLTVAPPYPSTMIPSLQYLIWSWLFEHVKQGKIIVCQISTADTFLYISITIRKYHPSFISASDSILLLPTYLSLYFRSSVHLSCCTTFIPSSVFLLINLLMWWFLSNRFLPSQK